jgi:ribosomal-protein-alanine N-acetyltransferase
MCVLNLNFILFPVIETERLVLRELRHDDVNEVFILRSDPAIMRYLDRAPATSLVEAKGFIDMNYDALHSSTGICWGISLKDGPKLIGTTAIWRIEKEHHRGEIGYTLFQEYQGKGIMNEALKAMIDYGFGTMKLHSLEANVNPANEASIKLLERSGFIKEAHFKENYYFDGKYLDSAIYSSITPLKH